MNSPISFSPRLLIVLGFILSSTGALRAADPEPVAEEVAGAQLSPEQLDELLGPIALYPDALIALILPASTSPAEVVLAARFVNANGDPAQIDNQPWSDSVRGLAHYPEVITWMDTNLQWTKEVGDAFSAQSADVMNSVQHLRTLARANGTLVDTPEQRVVVEDQSIEIIPAQPDVIYIPRYDPEIVYIERPVDYYSSGPFITFGAGFAAGLWLNYDFDWHRRVIWVGDRRHDWREHRDWRNRQAPGPNYPNNPNWHAWRPPVHRPAPPRDIHRPAPPIVHPRLFPGTPNFPHPPRVGGTARPPGSSEVRQPPRRPDNNRPGQGNPAPGAPRNQPEHRQVTLPNNAPNLNRATPVQPNRATPVQPNRATPIELPRATPIDATRATPPAPTREVINPGPRPQPPPPNHEAGPGPRAQNPAPAAKPAPVREAPQREKEKEN